MSQNMFDLSGKKALVTGAGRSIGRAVALGLARAGAEVALVARSAEQLEEVAAEIKALGRSALVAPFDLTQVEGLPGLVDQVAGELGGVDILINNAGVNIPQMAVEITPQGWDTVMDLNLKACFFLSQAVGRQMISQGRGGRMVNLSSQAGSLAMEKRAVYCASKAGVNLLTKCLALEWAPHEILVNAIAPTFTKTEMTKKFMQDPAYMEFALARNLLGRMAEPEDMVGAVVFLCSPAAGMITGVVLPVDAGWTAC